MGTDKDLELVGARVPSSVAVEVEELAEENAKSKSQIGRELIEDGLKYRAEEEQREDTDQIQLVLELLSAGPFLWASVVLLASAAPFLAGSVLFGSLGVTIVSGFVAAGTLIGSILFGCVHLFSGLYLNIHTATAETRDQQPDGVAA